jgi:hypothetical protein
LEFGGQNSLDREAVEVPAVGIGLERREAVDGLEELKETMGAYSAFSGSPPVTRDRPR